MVRMNTGQWVAPFVWRIGIENMREEHAQFEAVLANLERIAKFITQFMETSGLSEEQVYHFEISTDEHVSNLIEHAFKNRSNPLIDITCREDADKAQVIICDD